jgi:DnaJ-class molecular chaperone
MAKPKNEEWELGESFESFRVKENDPLSSLLGEIEENRGEFIRSALLKYYEGELLIDCPTCEGDGHIFSGSKAKPAPKAKQKSESNKSRMFSFRSDIGLQKDLARAKDKGEIIKMSLTVALSKEHTLDCPTCRGVGKVIGGPKKRKAALAKLSL